MREVGVLLACGSGLLSFPSPGVLPLTAGYLSFISGYGLAGRRGGEVRGRALDLSLAFVLGFSLVFIALGIHFGGGAFLDGSFPKPGQEGEGLSTTRTLGLAAGTLVLLFGFGLVFDTTKHRPKVARRTPRGRLAGLAIALLVGMALAAGWSPSIGTTLASILLHTSREPGLGSSVALLGSYSLGLGLPFLVAGLLLDRIPALGAFGRGRVRRASLVPGAILVTLGLAMAFGRLAMANTLASRAGYAVKELLASSPDLIGALAATAWLTLGASALLVPLLRRRPLKKPLRLILILVPLALGALELAGLVSTPTLVSDWLLYQGA